MKRIYHPWDLWECYRAGFYESAPPSNMTPEQALEAYATFLRDTSRFEGALDRVLEEWQYSCEHFLSNESLNRIAWLGQSSMCIATGVPARFRAGFKLLTAEEQETANATAERTLTTWIEGRNHAKEDRPLHSGLDATRIPEWNPERSSATAYVVVSRAELQGDLFRHFT